MKMKIFLIITLLLLSSVYAIDVDPAINNILQSNDEVSVIVILKEGADKQKDVFDELDVKSDDKGKVKEFLTAFVDGKPDLELKREYNSINGFSGEVTREGLNKLKNNDDVETIFLNKILHINLDNSVPQINADSAWQVSVSGTNITGSSETVCLVDTGIDTDHTAFQDKIKAQYCYCSVSDEGAGGCCPDTTTEDISAEDDQGHGTHVSGIAAGNHSAYSGVAKDANIVSIKVCNSGGACSTDDIISGIEWCVNNATKYNISVISMSLGDTSENTNYCNSDPIASSINLAVGKNITVAVASGNSGHSNGIAAPACVQNATPVGAVTSSDSIIYNRGPVLNLLTPGVSITGPYKGGGTKTQSGTSMSAPHLAGAIALFRQYWKLAYNIVPTPAEIEHKFKITGKVITDSGNTYSRLDVLKALQPYLNYTDTSIQDNLITNSNSLFVSISSDVDLSSTALELTNSISTNHTMNQTGSRSFYLTIDDLSEGVNTYKVYGDDVANTTGVSSGRTITLDTTKPGVSILSPTISIILGNKLQNFNISVNDLNINSVILNFDNSSGNGFNLTTTNNSGNWNVNLDISKLTHGTNTFTVFAYDGAGNVNSSESLQFNVDHLAPSVTFLSNSGMNYSLSSGSQQFIINTSDNLVNISGVYFSIDGNQNFTASNQNNSWVASYNVSSLTEGIHTLTAIVNDSLGNINSSESISFTIDNSPPQVSFNSPIDGAILTYGSLQKFNITVADSVNIDSVSFIFDNANETGFILNGIKSGNNWLVSYNVSGFETGNHSLTISANDSLGNLNNSEVLSFVVEISNPIVNLTYPDNQHVSLVSDIAFNCSVSGALDNVTLYGNWSDGWHANETTEVSGNKKEVSFSKTLSDGNYKWNCLLSDLESTKVFATTNNTLMVDSNFPQISSVSTSVISVSGATITWTTNENANSSVNYGNSTSLGSSSIDGSYVTSHSITLDLLDEGTTYYYNVTSCDIAGHCTTTGTSGFSTTSSSSEDDGGSNDDADDSAPSPSPGAGGGGGGSGSSNSGITTAAAIVEEKIPDIAKDVIPEVVPVVEPVVEEPQTVEHIERINLTEREPLTINILSEFSVKQLVITSNLDKELDLKISKIDQPENVTTLSNVYEYLEINVNLTEQEIRSATLIFTISSEWLTSNNLSEKGVVLSTFSDGDWQKLRTKLLSKDNFSLTYEARLKHFSYFAISSTPERNGNFITGFFSAIIPSKVTSKGYVFIGLLVLILGLGTTYFFLNKKWKEEGLLEEE